MLEVVSRCPMCASDQRHNRFQAIPDFVFRATNERWAIDECNKCASLFLAKRPRKEVIGRYYDRYYTHDNQSEFAAISGISVQSSTAKRIANSWRNYKYGTNRPSLGKLGTAIALAIPPLREWIDAECRHLPSKKATSHFLRVLDIGHGDARFLKFVREIGHQAAGLEIDPTAVAQAKADKLDVHQGDVDVAFRIWGEAYFDYITMSHVIEHVHEPRSVIAAAARLLKPGGQLWIECPNPRARGLKYYEARWRDLDPPRHLCIPSMEALRDVAAENGLMLKERRWRPFVPFEVYPFSAQASGQSARAGYIKAAKAEILSYLQRDQREWLTVTFTKPIG